MEYFYFDDNAKFHVDNHLTEMPLFDVNFYHDDTGLVSVNDKPPARNFTF